MSPLDEYLRERITSLLKQSRVVVWYDAHREFAPYVGALPREAADSVEAVPVVNIGETAAHLAQFEGSFFGLRMSVELLVAVEQPVPLLVYIPGEERDSRSSILMELEMAGKVYDPRLKALARHVMRQKYTDPEIDKLLQPEGLTYGDIVRLLEQGGTGGSLLKLIFPGRIDFTTLLAAWMASEESDQEVRAKGAEGELFRVLRTHIGLGVDPGTDLTHARALAARYTLIHELRSTLSGTPPASISMIPRPEREEDARHLKALAERLRRDHPKAYAALADTVETGLQLPHAGWTAKDLGTPDTFRFTERVLLGECDRLIAKRRYTEARAVCESCGQSFWVERDVLRQAQWQACRWMADLGERIEAIRPRIGKMGKDPKAWTDAYTSEDGWHQADQLHRNLEAWVAGMDDPPDNEPGFQSVRQEYEKLVRQMAEAFTPVLAAAGWSVSGILHQTQVFPRIVDNGGSRVAYFLVDSMRYEMGAELCRHLAEAHDLTLRAAVAALPTITPVGMAALLPGASGSFSVVEHKGKLAARIEESFLSNWQDRKRYLLAVRPDAVEMTLDDLLQSSPAKLQKRIESASLVVIRSVELDFLGESGNDLLARQVMNTVIGNIARAVRILARAGLERFVISADHGHQFSAPKGSDMVTDNPRGDTVKVERRCWIGRGGHTPPGAVRVTGAELGYDTDLDFIFPIGLGVFQTYGGLGYHHGGASLQELIVPVVSLRIPTSPMAARPAEQVTLSDYPEAITNRVFTVKVLYHADLLNRDELRTVRVVALANGEQVARAEMAIDATCDASTGAVTLTPGQPAIAGLLLAREDATVVKVIVQDPASDAVLAETPELPVKLGI